jgi:hypothetical protein
MQDLLEEKGFFDDLNREEFIQLLIESGFDVSDGEGTIIFTGEVEEEISFTLSMDEFVLCDAETFNSKEKINAFPWAS